MRRINRDDVMQSRSVHNLTKDILRMSIGKDPVDVLHDVELALIVLKNEWGNMKKENERLLDVFLNGSK